MFNLWALNPFTLCSVCIFIAVGAPESRSIHTSGVTKTIPEMQPSGPKLGKLEMVLFCVKTITKSVRNAVSHLFDIRKVVDWRLIHNVKNATNVSLTFCAFSLFFVEVAESSLVEMHKGVAGADSVGTTFQRVPPGNIKCYLSSTRL